MKEERFQVVISAKDDLSKVLKDIEKQFIEAQKRMGNAVESTTKKGREWGDWMKEERQQNRRLGFIMRETAGSANFLSNTLVGPSGLTKGIYGVFDAAQGMDFALSGLNQTLGGSESKVAKFVGALAPWGLGIGAVAGGFFLLNDHLEQTNKKLKESQEYLFKIQQSLGLVPTETLVSKLAKDVEKLRGELDKLKEPSRWEKFTAFIAANTGLVGQAFAPLALGARASRATEENTTQANLLKAQNELKQANIKAQNESLMQSIRVGGKFSDRGLAALGTLGVGDLRLDEMGRETYLKKPEAAPAYLGGISPAEAARQEQQAKQELEAYEKKLKDELALEEKASQEREKMVEAGTEVLLDSISEGFSEMWEGLFGEANSVLEKAFASLTSALVGSLAKSAGEKLLDKALGFLGFHSGGVIPRAHSGAYISPFGLKSDEVPIIAQSGERILSREQNAAFEAGSRPINITVQALDAESVNRMLTRRDVQRALVEAIQTAQRQGVR